MSFLKSMHKLVGVALAPAKYAGDVASSVVAHMKDKVEPEIGSVVRGYLYGAEHTGIYVGGGDIIHWTRHSKVERCPKEDFKSWSSRSIYVSCKGTEPVGSPKVADYAISKEGQGEKERGAYDPTSNNCHMFVIECLTGKKCESRWEEPNEHCKQYLGADEWRVWKGT
ncbi:lecithin retinol acyltransferase family protein [Helicobacter salomonis]|uniref:lecithin retinol acyltransferase family protein n=1 Tax=Helicobacter salomonis TaxID=56878 RepID=UPI000CF16C37|nr:lecithin retinol acyltransferase family protein [Helicobacter salomonis]